MSCNVAWMVVYGLLKVFNRKTQGVLGKGFRHRAEKGLSVWKSAVCFVTHSGKVGQYWPLKGPFRHEGERVRAGARRRSRKGESCGSKVGQERVGRWVAGRQAVEQMWAELRTSFTQRHCPIDVSITAWSRKGKENKNKIKFSILTHSTTGVHTVRCLTAVI